MTDYRRNFTAGAASSSNGCGTFSKVMGFATHPTGCEPRNGGFVSRMPPERAECSAGGLYLDGVIVGQFFRVAILLVRPDGNGSVTLNPCH